MTRSTNPGAILADLLSAPIDTADSDTCATLLGDVKKVRGCVDAIEVRVSKRLRELHDTSNGAPVADEHARCGGVTSDEGRRKERRSKTLEDAPSFEDALANGEITSGHADALANATAKLDDDIKAELFGREDDLLADAIRLSPTKFGREVRDLIRRLERDHGVERNNQQRKQTFLSRKHNTQTGMTEGRFALHPELANQIFSAIDKEVAAMIKQGAEAGEPECQDRSVDRNRLAAEAWGNLIAGGHQAKRPLEADITVIVDWRTLIAGEIHQHSVCETGDGSPIPPTVAQQWMCNGTICPIIIDQSGERIDAGRSIRTANRTQRRALRAMYRTCAFGDCDVAFDRCEIHHVVPYIPDGLTDLDNLVPICSRHHHVIHTQRWQLELAPDRTLTIRRPTGDTYLICTPDITPDLWHQPAERRRPPAA